MPDDVIAIDRREPYGANVLGLRDRVIVPASFPWTAERISSGGKRRVVTVDAGEARQGRRRGDLLQPDPRQHPLFAVRANDMDDKRATLRHAVATVAYRGGKAVRDAPPAFAAYSPDGSPRTAVKILAHVGDRTTGP